MQGGRLNPVIGYEAYVAPASGTDARPAGQRRRRLSLTLLAGTRTGFKNLIKMASIAYLEGYHYNPRIDREVLAAHSEGLILSG